MFRPVCIGLFIALLIAVVAFSADWEVDGVYLLDVTGSMVGWCIPDDCPENSENLAQAIDLLEAEILAFEQGTFVLIPFAVGPHDLDGPFGSASDILVERISDSPQDLGRTRLLRFLKPEKYGPYTDPETNQPLSEWEGVLVAVMSGNQGTKTAIYDTLQLGLTKLDELIDPTDGTYLETHAQRLVILTDGRDTASKEADEEGIRKALEERYQNKEKPDFLLTRYHWGAEPPPPLEGNTYRVDGPATFYRINLDRLRLRFPGNAWFSATLRLDPVCIPSITTTQVGGDILVDWGEIQISTEEFEIRESGTVLDDVAVSVRPSTIFDAIQPGYCFPLEIELTPQSVLREAMEHTGLVEGTIAGKLRFAYTPDWAIGRHAAFTRYLVGVEIPFQRPNLSVQVVDEAARIALRISGNNAYRDFSLVYHGQDSVRIVYDQTQFSLVDENYRPVSSELAVSRFSTPSVLYLIPTAKLGAGVYQGTAEVIAPGTPGEVLLNGQTAFSWAYELAKVGFDGPSLRFEENVWAPRAELESGGARTMTLDGIRLIGVPSNWTWARFHVFPDEFLFRAKAETRATGQDEFDLSVEIPSLSEVELVKNALNSGTPAGHIRFVYADTEGDGRLVVIDPERVPVYVHYRPSWIGVEKSESACVARSAGEAAQTVTLSRSEDLLPANAGLDIHLDQPNLVNLKLDGEAAGAESWGFSGDSIKLVVKAGLPQGRYRGAVTLRPSSGGVYLLGLTSEPTTEYRVEYCFDVEQCSYVRLTDSALDFGNPWIDSVSEGEATALSEDSLRFSPPDYGPLPIDATLRLVVPQGGWPLPDGLLGVPLGESIMTVSEFRGEQGQVRLPLRELEKHLAAFSSDADPLEGHVYLESANELQCIVFETPSGTVEDRLRMTFTLDVHRPWIRLEVTRATQTTYHGGDVFLTVEASYDPAIPTSQRELAIESDPDLLQVGQEESLVDSNQAQYSFTINSASPLAVDQAGTIRFRCAGNPHVLINGYEVLEYSYSGLDRQAGIDLAATYTDDLARKGELRRRLPGELVGELDISGGEEFDLLPEDERGLLVHETLSTERSERLTPGPNILCFHDGSRTYVDGDLIHLGGEAGLKLRLSVCSEAPKGEAFDGVLRLIPISEHVVQDGAGAVYEYPFRVSVRHRLVEIILAVVLGLFVLAAVPLVAGFVAVMGISLAQKNPPTIVLSDLYRRSDRGWARLLPFALLGLAFITIIAWFVIRGMHVH